MFRLVYYTSIDRTKRKANCPAPLIAYIRVSTAVQGSSVLGLEATRGSNRRYAEQNGLTIAAEFEEVVSTRKDRPIFEPTLLMCEQFGRTLAVARLDRNARKEVVERLAFHRVFAYGRLTPSLLFRLTPTLAVAGGGGGASTQTDQRKGCH